MRVGWDGTRTTPCVQESYIAGSGGRQRKQTVRGIQHRRWAIARMLERAVPMKYIFVRCLVVWNSCMPAIKEMRDARRDGKEKLLQGWGESMNACILRERKYCQCVCLTCMVVHFAFLLDVLSEEKGE